MATILRDWSYRYQWLYDAISWMAALTVGGEDRFRQLALEGVAIAPDTQVLDLCCGSGQATQYLVQRSQQVTGLDASPRSIQRARQNVPQATFVEGWAERMPFADATFDLVHISAALHEMEPEPLEQILQEVYRVLKPGGWLTLVDFHTPTNPVFWLGLAPFLWLFETETAWQLLRTDLVQHLKTLGFQLATESSSHGAMPRLLAGGSLQVIYAAKPR